MMGKMGVCVCETASSILIYKPLYLGVIFFICSIASKHVPDVFQQHHGGVGGGTVHRRHSSHRLSCQRDVIGGLPLEKGHGIHATHGRFQRRIQHTQNI